MTSIEVQGAVVVATMRDVAGRVYEADAPVLDGRGGLPSPLGRLASYLYCLAILIWPHDFLSASGCSQRSQQDIKQNVKELAIEEGGGARLTVAQAAAPQ